MGAFIDYHLPDSGSIVCVGFTAFYEYRLQEGSKLRIHQQPAWCRVCGEFVTAEALRTVEDVEREIGQLQSWLGERKRRQAGQKKVAEEMLAELQRRLRWR